MSLNIRLFNEVDKTISPQDSMFQGNQDHYFFVGYSGINCINNALIMTGIDPSTIKTILDLPSGYGRVLRWITAAFPEAEITACDLDFDAVNFCSEHLGAKKLYSQVEPEKIICEDKFDLIWCGSLFTHLESKKWGIFLKFFNDKLNPDGILVFTTHGPYVVSRATNGFDYGLMPGQIEQITKKFIDSGFGYENYHSSTNYGISFAKPSFTLKLLEENTDLNLIFYQEKGWDHHQDVIGCFKDTHFSERYFSGKYDFK
jgi:SAM-dependent methyltransferase